MPTKPPTTVTLTWIGDLTFSAGTGKSSITIDSPGVAGPSPVETLAIALAGCMSTDLVYILTKGRHKMRGLATRLVAERADDDPRRVVGITMLFRIDGDVPDAAVERAIELSRAKYCSVWHSMRQDIAFATTWERER